MMREHEDERKANAQHARMQEMRRSSTRASHRGEDGRITDASNRGAERDDAIATRDRQPKETARDGNTTCEAIRFKDGTAFKFFACALPIPRVWWHVKRRSGAIEWQLMPHAGAPAAAAAAAAAAAVAVAVVQRTSCRRTQAEVQLTRNVAHHREAAVKAPSKVPQLHLARAPPLQQLLEERGQRQHVRSW